MRTSYRIYVRQLLQYPFLVSFHRYRFLFPHLNYFDTQSSEESPCVLPLHVPPILSLRLGPLCPSHMH